MRITGVSVTLHLLCATQGAKLYLLSPIEGFSGSLGLKNLLANQKTWVRSLGQEDPIVKEMAIHSSILVWEIPWTQEPSGLRPWGRKSDMTE